MTEGGGSGLPGNDVVMPAQAGIQYAVSARSGNALIAMAVSTGCPLARAMTAEGQTAPDAGAVRGRGCVSGRPPGRRGNGADQSFLSVFSARLRAVPRMSPSVAPESEEPYWAIASFSSATSSALIETCTLWVRRSNWMM